MATTKAFKLLAASAIGTVITNALTNLAKADENIHIAAVQSVAHIEAHGDWTLLKRLMVGLKASGYRFQGVRVWIEAHSPVRFPADKEADGGFTIKVLKPADKGYTPFDIPAMWARSFREFEPANERTGRPVYTDSFVGLVQREKARFLRLLENTAPDGTPKDPAKDYFRGDISEGLRYLNDLEGVKAPKDDTKANDEKAALRAAETLTVAPPAKPSRKAA